MGERVRKSYIVLIAFAIYGLLMIIGGTVYYVYTVREERLAAQAAARAAVTEQVKEKSVAPTAEEVAAEKAAAERAEQAKKLEQEKDALLDTMQEDTVNGITYYHYKKVRQPVSGVYLYPSVGVGNGKCFMRLEIYYFYSIDDPEQTAWVFGDRLDLHAASGAWTTLALNPQAMVKHVAKDASYLSETHTVTIADEAIAALRALGESGGKAVYYQQGGKSRVQQLNREQMRHIHDMVRLYDIMKAE